MNDSLKPMIDYTSEKDYKSMSSTPWNNSSQSSCSGCTSEFDETPESEEIPLNHNIDKQLSFIISFLKVLGIVKLRGKLGSLIIWITLPLMWVPVVYLSICITKADHVMASPSGLPTVLLFAGMAGSQLFGVRYSTSHYRDLRANIRLALASSAGITKNHGLPVFLRSQKRENGGEKRGACDACRISTC